jgi:hypothetical protein
LKPHEHNNETIKHNPAFDDQISALREVIQKEMEDKLKAAQEAWDKASPGTRSPDRPVRLTHAIGCRVQ